MSPTIERLYRAPYSMPNGLEFTSEGLWIVDQMTDRIALVSLEPPGDPDYFVFKLLCEIPSESSNTSGLAYGGGFLWLAANGSGRGLWRPPRSTDAQDGQAEIYQVDPATGATVNRYPILGGGGTHGVAYDPYAEGMLWLTTFKLNALTQVRISDWAIQRQIPLPHAGAHGVVRVQDGLWVVFKHMWSLIKLDLEDGRELARITVPKHLPEVHGLTRYGDDLLYCDATSGWVVRIHMHDTL